MALGITAATHHLGLHPAGGWREHRRGDDRLRGWDQTREQGEHEWEKAKKALHGFPCYWTKTTAEAISQDACGGKTAMPILVATLAAGTIDTSNVAAPHTAVLLLAVDTPCP